MVAEKKCRYCRGEGLSPCRCAELEADSSILSVLHVPLSELQKQEVRTGAELLAAEASYLTAHGWIPYAIPRDAKLSAISWQRKGELATQLYNQEQALRLQKYLDPAFKDGE